RRPRPPHGPCPPSWLPNRRAPRMSRVCNVRRAGAGRGAIDRQARGAFRMLRWWLLSNTVQSLLSGSRLRTAMVLICSAVFWVGLFGLFFGGFQFIALYVSLANELVEYLFSLFFLSLLFMLFFSTGIIVYSGLFQSREAAFLLTTPAPSDRVFAYKFLEAIGFSSWGFLLLGSPMMVAYGIAVQAPTSFYVLFFAYLLTFVVIPGCLGAVGAILVALLLPRRQKTVLVLGGVGLLAAAAALGFRMVHTPGETLSDEWLGGLL